MNRRRYGPKKPAQRTTRLLREFYAPHKDVAPSQPATPAGWDAMTEAEREVWREKEWERLADMATDWNPLIAG